MSDLPDFVSDEPSSAPEIAPEAVAPPEAAAPPADAEPAPLDAAPAAPPPGVLPHHVPLTTFLDVRDRLSNAEKEARELRQWRQQQEAAANRQPPPDRNEDPEAWEAHREAARNNELYVMRLENSRNINELRHGPDVTRAAYEWGVQRCDQDPYFNQKLFNSRDPVGVAIAEWKREQLLSRIDPNELDAFQQWKAAQAPAAPGGQPATAAPAAPSRPQAPRPSLAAGPSAGAHAAAIPRDGEATFDAMFRT